MSISTIQKKRKQDEFVKILARKGIEPNNYELNAMLTEYFDNKVIGMPVYAPIAQVPYDQSSKDDYNHNFKGIEEDLEVLFQADTEANNKAVAVQEYYDREKSKVFNAISSLALKIQNIEEALKSASHVRQYCESFQDMYGVEFYENEKRNIPATTAFIDLLQKCVYTDKTKAQVNRLSISDATIKVVTSEMFENIEYSDDISNILSDIATDVCLITYKSVKDESKTLELIVDLGTDMEFNTVLFRFLSSTGMKCTLYLSDDNKNWVVVYDMTSNELIEWNFTKQRKRYIKICCTKDEYDGISGTSDSAEIYEYYYLLKNISIALEEYQESSVLVSKLIDFDDLTSVIRLDAEDLTFNHTRIDYFIGFDNETGKIGWDTIENHKDYELFMFQKLHKIANRHLPEFGSQDPSQNGYIIYEIPDNVNRNSMRVIPAYNQWSVTKYSRETVIQNFSISTSDFSEFTDGATVSYDFMDCENYDGFRIQTNKLYIFTQYVSLDHDDSLYNVSFRITDYTTYRTTLPASQIRIFLNGYEMLAAENGLYSFALKKGMNKIQIAVYDPNDRADIEHVIYHNINFKALTNDIFGFPPMKYINPVVMDRVIGDNYAYYTIKSNMIYVKCDPNLMIHSSETEDMGYFISYSALRSGMMTYFKDNHLKFRIMAIFNSDNKNVSPKLLSFRLTGR